MFPPPITSATSSPSRRTWTSSFASSSTVRASNPNSCEPIRASPESFSRTRLNATTTSSLTDRVPGVVEELDPALLQVLRDRPGRLVRPVPRLLGQHGLAVELLVQLALDDLLAHVLGLAEHLVGMRKDLALGVDELLRDLVAAPVGGPCEREMQREAAPDFRIAAARFHHCTDLVRRRVHVRRDRLIAVCLHALRPDDLDVLTELCSELDALGFERFRVAAVEDGRQDLLRIREEVVVVRDGLGLAADRSDRSDVLAHHHADLAFARLAVCPLRGRRHALLAEQLHGLVEVTVRLDERALALHHPGAGRVPELLDHRGRDVGQLVTSVSVAGASTAGTAAAGSSAGAAGSSAGAAGASAPAAGSSTAAGSS